MQELQALAQDISAFIQGEGELVVSSQEDYARAGDAVKIATVKIKNVTETRLAMTRPLDESKRRIMEEAEKVIAPLEAFVKRAKDSMLAWHRAEQARIAKEAEEARRKALEEERARQAAAEAERQAAIDDGVPDLGDVPVAPAPPAPVIKQPEDIKTTRGNVSTVTVREDWKFEVTDPAAIPAEYMTPDLVKIGKAVRQGGVRQIPGVRIYDAGSVVTR